MLLAENPVIIAPSSMISHEGESSGGDFEGGSVTLGGLEC